MCTVMDDVSFDLILKAFQRGIPLRSLFCHTHTHTVGSPRGRDSVTCPALKTISRGSGEMPMNGCCFCVELCEVNGSVKYLFSLQWLQICYKQVGFPKLII